MAPKYDPIITEVRMSDMGYWVVTISISPFQRMSVMICSLGLTRTEVEADALTTLTGWSARKRYL